MGPADTGIQAVYNTNMTVLYHQHGICRIRASNPNNTRRKTRRLKPYPQPGPWKGYVKQSSKAQAHVSMYVYIYTYL